MDIEELRTFVEVADSGGVSPAARRLGVSKSIVSRRLCRLESGLGIQLVARSTRGAALTEAGTTFRDYAAKVCADIDTAKETIIPVGELSGRLRIAAPLTFGPTHVAPVLAEMGLRHPQLQIQASYSDRFVDLIGEGYDCAIRVGHLPDSNLIARRFAPVHGSLFVSPDYIAVNGMPVTLEDLAKHQALLKGTESWRLLDGKRVVTVHPQGRFKADNSTALIAAAVAGLGIVYLPNSLAQDHVNSGALVPVLTDNPPPPAGAYVVRPPGQHPARKIRVLTELLLEYFDE